ncbi:hypothetical protein K2173_003191 [Erythroxylum novogranatense]|uniref:Pentatricopeptide repeat-containing protein n=1 Tax=Erythroxylum novogranatense TaxID=1862640 RepID=A0AAV8SXB8_9ROSI|nr:hypothetical protein K2173_003191 [Erythroxylum novogranatense]
MLSSKLVPCVRTITNLTPRLVPLSSSASSLLLDSYCETNIQDLVYSKNRELDILIKCGRINTAYELFDKMPLRDVVSFNLLISGYRKQGASEKGLFVYWELVSQGFRENPSTFSSVLGICSDAGLLVEGIQAQCRVLKLGLSSNLFIGSALVGFYMRLGQYDLAICLFDELPRRNLGVWNLVLSGHSRLGEFDELSGFYRQMKLDGVEANGLTFSYLMRGCCNEKFLSEGKQLHCHVIKVGLVESNVFVANVLVDFYSACSCLSDARKSFEAIQMGDVISWNSIVSIYADNDLLVESLELFQLMQIFGKGPSIRSFVGVLNLSSRLGDVLLGRQIHCCVLKVGFDCRSVHVQSALVDMYGKCKDIESSVSVYKSIPERNLECCNSLMTSLLHAGIVEDVVEMFGLMVDEGIGLDEVTLSTTLEALSESSLASLASCSLVHSCAIKSGFETDIAVSCSLIDSYLRSGDVKLSQQVFDQIPSPNVICFTSMIKGFARNGMGNECLKMFDTMIQNGLSPDRVTFMCVLTGCSHSGLVEEGRLIFNSMEATFGISPDREHFSCMVDLLGRAGLLNEAEELLQKALRGGDCVMWGSLLRSCRIHRNEIIGRRAAEALLEINPKHSAVYLQISNFFAEIGQFEASMQIREVAMAKKITAEIGCSLLR